MSIIIPSVISPNELYLSGLGWEIADKNRVLPTFARNHFRFHFITGGTGYLKTQKESFTLTEGLGFIIFPGETPNYHPDHDNPWQYFWAAVHGELMENLVAECGLTRSEPVFKNKLPIDEMRHLLMDMCITSIMPDAAEKIFPYYLCDFFHGITPYKSAKRYNSGYFEQCLAYIHSNYTENINIQKLSSYAAIDRTYLYKLFKQNLGISPQTYLINHRISKACELLRSTNDSITQIAFSVGFKDFSDFSRQFKRRHLMAPSMYRQTSSGDTLKAKLP